MTYENPALEKLLELDRRHDELLEKLDDLDRRVSEVLLQFRPGGEQKPGTARALEGTSDKEGADPLSANMAADAALLVDSTESSTGDSTGEPPSYRRAA